MVAQTWLKRRAGQLCLVFAGTYALILFLLFVWPTLRLPHELNRLSQFFALLPTSLLVWVPALFVAVYLAYAGWWWVRQAFINQQLKRYGRVRILLPRADGRATIDDGIGFWHQVSSLIPKYRHLTFEVTGDGRHVSLSICALDGTSRALIHQMMAGWPGASSRPVEKPEDDPLFVPDGRHTWQVVLRPKRPQKSLKSVIDDPLMPTLAEISRFPEGVKGGVLCLIRSDAVSRRKLGQEAAQASSQSSSGQSLEQKREVKAADSRAQAVFLEVELIVWTAAGSPEMAKSVAHSLARNVMAQYEAGNPLMISKENKQPPRRMYGVLNGRPWTHGELATLAHLVGKEGKGLAPQLQTAPARALPPSPACRVPATAHVRVMK